MPCRQCFLTMFFSFVRTYARSINCKTFSLALGPSSKSQNLRFCYTRLDPIFSAIVYIFIVWPCFHRISLLTGCLISIWLYRVESSTLKPKSTEVGLTVGILDIFFLFRMKSKSNFIYSCFMKDSLFLDLLLILEILLNDN